MYPATNKLLPIAQVLKSYGTDGSVIISFLPDMPEDIDLKEPVFLIFEGLSVPFFIEKFERRGSNKALVKFEDIETLYEAEEIVGKKVLANLGGDGLDDVDGLDGLSLEDLVGYEVLDQNGLSQGKILDILDFSGNICLSLPEDRLIPFHEDLVISLDEVSSTLSMNIPDGI